MGIARKCSLLPFLVCLQLFAQEPESLWAPEGYRFLSAEEARSLSPDALKAIGTRNGELLENALRGLSASDCEALAQRLALFSQIHSLPLAQRQYVTRLQMRLLAKRSEEREAPKRDQAKRDYERLLIQQEESTRGFASDPDSIAAEAQAVESRIGKEDLNALYLRILRPLRARPWNNSVRFVFRNIVRMDPTRPGNTSLYDAALAFLHAREKETPEEGSWHSMEAFLRLVLRQEVPEARRLFAVAIAKRSRDVESRLYPLLLAEMDGDTAEANRLRPRAAEAWPKPAELDEAILASIDPLPHELASRARETYGKKYKGAHPSDWASRVQHMNESILDAEMKALRGDRSAQVSSFHAIDQEATILLQLPLSALPEPRRTDVFALQLRARSGLGRCDEVSPEIARLDRAAAAAYPREVDFDAPPLPRTTPQAAALRVELQKERLQLEKLKAALADGSIWQWPGWKTVPQSERSEAAAQMVKETEAAVAEAEKVIRDRDDSQAALEWTRRELAAWEAAHNIPPGEGIGTYDISGRAERLSILVRAGQGRCLVARRRPAEAVLVLEPCVGGGRNYHADCVRPMSDAALALLEMGETRRAAAIFQQIEPSSLAGELYVALERAAPGLVQKRPGPVSKPVDP